jgi:hypothetical protein
MKKNSYAGFFVSVVAIATILNALPMNDMKFAHSKLAGLLQSDLRLREQVAERCSSLSSREETSTEKLILENLPVPTRPTNSGPCFVFAQSAQATRWASWDRKVFQNKFFRGSLFPAREAAAAFGDLLSQSQIALQKPG